MFRFCFIIIRPSPRSTPFPYTTLFRSSGTTKSRTENRLIVCFGHQTARLLHVPFFEDILADGYSRKTTRATSEQSEDRKSTRLNSSHSQTSYAVFCLTTTTPDATLFRA